MKNENDVSAKESGTMFCSLVMAKMFGKEFVEIRGRIYVLIFLYRLYSVLLNSG